MRQMNEQATFIFRSQTEALKAKKLLGASKINAVVVREHSKSGCVFGVSVYSATAAAAVLRKNGMAFEKVANVL